jgi:hypothetical protein
MQSSRVDGGTGIITAHNRMHTIKTENKADHLLVNYCATYVHANLLMLEISLPQ